MALNSYLNKKPKNDNILKVHMKKIIFSILSITSLSLHASTVLNCDQFEVKAYVKKAIGNKLNLIVNAKTQSEIELEISKTSQASLIGYRDLYISANITAKNFDGYKGEASNVTEIKLILPDPLVINKNENFKFLKKIGCTQ